MLHVHVSLLQVRMNKMLLAASEGEVSSTVDHEAKLREMLCMSNKVITIQLDPSMLGTASSNTVTCCRHPSQGTRTVMRPRSAR